MHLKVSKDHRTTADNPAFVAYVMLTLADQKEREGNQVVADILTATAAGLVKDHGMFPPGVLVQPQDWNAVVSEVVSTFDAEVSRLESMPTADGARARN